jgi:hypothetical protein
VLKLRAIKTYRQSLTQGWEIFLLLHETEKSSHGYTGERINKLCFREQFLMDFLKDMAGLAMQRGKHRGDAWRWATAV